MLVRLLSDRSIDAHTFVESYYDEPGFTLAKERTWIIHRVCLALRSNNMICKYKSRHEGDGTLCLSSLKISESYRPDFSLANALKESHGVDNIGQPFSTINFNRYFLSSEVWVDVCVERNTNMFYAVGTASTQEKAAEFFTHLQPAASKVLAFFAKINGLEKLSSTVTDSELQLAQDANVLDTIPEMFAGETETQSYDFSSDDEEWDEGLFSDSK